MPTVVRFPNLLFPWAGFAVLSLYTAAMRSVATLLLTRRDV